MPDAMLTITFTPRITSRYPFRSSEFHSKFVNGEQSWRADARWGLRAALHRAGYVVGAQQMFAAFSMAGWWGKPLCLLEDTQMTTSYESLKLGLVKAPTPIPAGHPHPGMPNPLSGTLTRRSVQKHHLWTPGVQHRAARGGVPRLC